ncbi:MAG: DUF882 domain-containing protein [Myxococcales bacterium]|nr:DUF882 domain-containing protein [Myxococcales bacterium]
MVLAGSVGACSSADERPPAWNPELSDDGTTTEDAGDGSTGRPPGDGGDDTTAGDDGCTPGEVIGCACPEGGLGEQTCDIGGQGFGPCACDDGGTTSGGTDDTGEPGTTTDDGGGMAQEVCYPGPASDFTTCLPLHYFDPLPAGYEYPEPYMGNEDYRAPIALLDLQEVDPATYLAPNFQLVEIAQAEKGRYAVVQPHAVVALQGLRDEVGAIVVNSGYRSPAYNAALDGSATYSRHMYGDAYDLDPVEVGLSTLETACTASGGMLVEYTTHVHCDFRFDPVDEEFYGPPMAADEAPRPTFEAALVQADDGGWSAPAEGFEEGAPQRRWVARDEQGQVLATAVAERFWPPAGTATVEVRVGAQVERTAEVGLGR